MKVDPKINFFTDLITVLILLYFIINYMFYLDNYEKKIKTNLNLFIICYIILLLIISKYNFNISIGIFGVSILIVLYLDYLDHSQNHSQNHRQNHRQRQNKWNSFWNNINNNNINNNNNDFNYDPNVPLSKEEVQNLVKLAESNKPEHKKCMEGYGIDLYNKNRKICRSLLKKYHADKISRNISTEEERNTISTQFNNCCY